MRGYVELFRLGKTYDTPTGSAVIVENFDLNLQQGEYVMSASPVPEPSGVLMIATSLAVALLSLRSLRGFRRWWRA